MLVEIYRMLKEDIPVMEICKTIKVSTVAYYKWMKKKPEMRKVVELVQRERESEGTFPQWIYSKLPAHLKELWDKITELEQDEVNGIGKIEILLQDHGRRARQQLFLHALCMSSFSPSQAMKKVNITRRELEVWKTETEFAELIDEIQWHKGNFFEERLVDMCKEGNGPAIIFANKAYNKDRGYASRTEVEVNHTGTVMHGVLDLTELMPYLNEDQKVALLTAVRKREEDRARRLSAPVVIDMEAQINSEIAQRA